MHTRIFDQKCLELCEHIEFDVEKSEIWGYPVVGIVFESESWCKYVQAVCKKRLKDCLFPKWKLWSWKFTLVSSLKYLCFAG